MPSTVEDAFEALLNKIRHSSTETTQAASHRASIKARLEQTFGMTTFFRTGSFGNGTNIGGYSDVDYFAVFPQGNLKRDSSATLTAVAADLRNRFPLTANIRVDAPGIKIPFGLDGAEAVEIVPVDYTGQTKLNFRQFDMPDGQGGWKFSAPESHNAYVNHIDDRLGGRLKPLIRLIKAWKYFRNVPIRSFYLEMRTAAYASSESAIVYEIDIGKVLQLLQADRLATVIDPRFPDAGLILSGCSSQSNRDDALSKLDNAAVWATEAFRDRYEGRIKTAFGKWDLVFNYEFPSYNN